MLEKINNVYLVTVGLSQSHPGDPRGILKKLRSAFPTDEIQILRADRIVGKEHLVFAARNAMKAFHQQYNRSRSLAVEFLVYVSCQRQISRAIEMLGVTQRTREVVVVALTRNPVIHARLAKVAREARHGRSDDSIIDRESGRKISELKKAYGVEERELDASKLPGESSKMALKRLILERSALLGLEG